MRRTAILANVLGRRWVGSSPRCGQVRLGDFATRLPRLDRDLDSVYDALVRRFLHPRLALLTGPGLVLGVEEEPGWSDVLLDHATFSSGGELAAVASAEWVLLDRWLQPFPEMATALGDVVRRLMPGARLVTLFTGIARPEPSGRGPLWTVAPYAACRLHNERRELERVEVNAFGNVTLALAWLYRLSVDDLKERELTAVDPAYPVLVAVTASRRR